MKVLQSSLFRALCAIIVGVLLIKYREDTVTWITIAMGVLLLDEPFNAWIIAGTVLVVAGVLTVTRQKAV